MTRPEKRRRGRTIRVARRRQRRIVRFAREALGLELFPWQAQVILMIEAGPTYIVGGRRGGRGVIADVVNARRRG